LAAEKTGLARVQCDSFLCENKTQSFVHLVAPALKDNNMSFKLIHLLSKWCCVMPMNIGVDGYAKVDGVALIISAICMVMAGTESIYGTYWHVKIIATDLTLSHSMKVNAVFSIIAKMVTFVQISAISYKVLIGRKKLENFTNTLNLIRGVLFKKKKKCSLEIVMTCSAMAGITLITFFAYLKHYNVSEQLSVWWNVFNIFVTLTKFFNCCVITGINLQYWGYCQVHTKHLFRL